MCKYLHLKQKFSYTYFSFSLCAHCLPFTGLQALNKKENKGGESPELESVLALTPRTEEKYKQINEEFDFMIKTQKIPVSTARRGESRAKLTALFRS